MVLHNIKDSAVMLTCILMFILYCAFIGRFFFRSSFEGEAYFLTTLDSYWTMFQTLTTENYPDVFLLGYAENSLSALFFVLFTMVAVFFLLNVLLAVIFDNYKNRLERVQRSRQSQRLAAIEKFFDAYDTDKSGYLIKVPVWIAVMATVRILDPNLVPAIYNYMIELEEQRLRA